MARADGGRRSGKGGGRGSGGRDGGIGVLWLFVAVALPGSVVALPTVLVFSVGMVPTLVALLVDRDPNRTAGITVGCLNLCGVMPFLLELWLRGHSVAAAVRLLTDPVTWMVMFGAAAVGWGIYAVVPLWVVQLEVARAEHRIAGLRDRQRALVREWGADVAAVEEQPTEAPAAGPRAPTR